jgi:DNA-directed RNA polymerase subunit RPC12/RpoP
METKNMDYTPEAWDKEFEDFRSAVGQPVVSEDTLVTCEHCDWIGSIEDVQDELEPECPKCGHPIHLEDGTSFEDDVPLDGDFDSAMESIGWGYDEQYDHNDCYGGDY